MTPCAVPGCDAGGRRIRGWCPKHYQKWFKYGDPTTSVVVRLGDACEIEGCDRPPLARGWCDKHYKRWWNRGDPLAEPLHSVKCSVCAHPLRGVLELELVNGEHRPTVAARYGVTTHIINGHICNGHMGAVAPLRGRRCSVCVHPEIDEIDEILEQWASRSVSNHPPVGLSLPALGERFGLSHRALKNHTTPAHQQRRALYELGRLNALKETA